MCLGLLAVLCSEQFQSGPLEYVCYLKEKISGILVYRILQFCVYKSNHFAPFYFSFCSVHTVHSHWSCPLPKAYMQFLVSSGNVRFLYQDHTIPKKLFCQLSSESYVLYFLYFKKDRLFFFCRYLPPRIKEFITSLLCH